MSPTRYDPNRHHRRSIRLPGYDYAQPGAYFVTICTYNREHLFGQVVDGDMRLNQYGEIVRHEWFRSTRMRREIELYPGEFVVMPNHIHGIVWIVDIVGATGRVGATHRAGATGRVGATHRVGATGRLPLPDQPRGPTPRSLASFIAGFKSAVTKRINVMRGTPGAPVWQRNYWEHIIRDDAALQRIRRYIAENPLRWHLDRCNPHATGTDPVARDIWKMIREDARSVRTGHQRDPTSGTLEGTQ